MTLEPSTGSAPTAAPSSSLAIISLIAGILGLTLMPVLGSIIAVITGPMARREIAASGGTLSGEGLATAGMVLGWISLALTVIGLCVAGVIFGLPFCLLLLGIATSKPSSLLPLLFTLL